MTAKELIEHLKHAAQDEDVLVLCDCGHGRHGIEEELCGHAFEVKAPG